jgi:hypothetical protein
LVFWKSQTSEDAGSISGCAARAVSVDGIGVKTANHAVQIGDTVAVSRRAPRPTIEPPPLFVPENWHFARGAGCGR